jgi:hypothetical protein
MNNRRCILHAPLWSTIFAGQVAFFWIVTGLRLDDVDDDIHTSAAVKKAWAARDHLERQQRQRPFAGSMESTLAVLKDSMKDAIQNAGEAEDVVQTASMDHSPVLDNKINGREKEALLSSADSDGADDLALEEEFAAATARPKVAAYRRSKPVPKVAAAAATAAAAAPAVDPFAVGRHLLAGSKTAPKVAATSAVEHPAADSHKQQQQQPAGGSGSTVAYRGLVQKKLQTGTNAGTHDHQAHKGRNDVGIPSAATHVALHHKPSLHVAVDSPSVTNSGQQKEHGFMQVAWDGLDKEVQLSKEALQKHAHQGKEKLLGGGHTDASLNAEFNPFAVQPAGWPAVSKHGLGNVMLESADYSMLQSSDDSSEEASDYESESTSEYDDSGLESADYGVPGSTDDSMPDGSSQTLLQDYSMPDGSSQTLLQDEDDDEEHDADDAGDDDDNDDDAPMPLSALQGITAASPSSTSAGQAEEQGEVGTRIKDATAAEEYKAEKEEQAAQRAKQVAEEKVQAAKSAQAKAERDAQDAELSAVHAKRDVVQKKVQTLAAKEKIAVEAEAEAAAVAARRRVEGEAAEDLRQKAAVTVKKAAAATKKAQAEALKATQADQKAVRDAKARQEGVSGGDRQEVSAADEKKTAEADGLSAVMKAAKAKMQKGMAELADVDKKEASGKKAAPRKWLTKWLSSSAGSVASSAASVASNLATWNAKLSPISAPTPRPTVADFERTHVQCHFENGVDGPAADQYLCQSRSGCVWHTASAECTTTHTLAAATGSGSYCEFSNGVDGLPTPYKRDCLERPGCEWNANLTSCHKSTPAPTPAPLPPTPSPKQWTAIKNCEVAKAVAGLSGQDRATEIAAAEAVTKKQHGSTYLQGIERISYQSTTAPAGKAAPAVAAATTVAAPAPAAGTTPAPPAAATTVAAP